MFTIVPWPATHRTVRSFITIMHPDLWYTTRMFTIAIE